MVGLFKKSCSILTEHSEELEGSILAELESPFERYLSIKSPQWENPKQIGKQSQNLREKGWAEAGFFLEPSSSRELAAFFSPEGIAALLFESEDIENKVAIKLVALTSSGQVVQISSEEKSSRLPILAFENRHYLHSAPFSELLTKLNSTLSSPPQKLSREEFFEKMGQLRQYRLNDFFTRPEYQELIEKIQKTASTKLLYSDAPTLSSLSQDACKIAFAQDCQWSLAQWSQLHERIQIIHDHTLESEYIDDFEERDYSMKEAMDFEFDDRLSNRAEVKNHLSTQPEHLQWKLLTQLSSPIPADIYLKPY